MTASIFPYYPTHKCVGLSGLEQSVGNYLCFYYQGSSFRKMGDIPLKKGKELTRLDVMGQTYYINFILKWTGSSEPWQSVLHLTIDKDNGGYGERIPIVLISNGRMIIRSPVDGEDYEYSTRDPSQFSGEPVHFHHNELYRIEIEQIQKDNGKVNKEKLIWVL